MDLVATIPAYQEAETIGAVVDGTGEHVDEVVVVDDGSTDGTAAVARDRGATVIEHVFNAGVGAAVRTGYRYAIRNGYEYAVQIDGDGQHDPSTIPRLLDAAVGDDPAGAADDPAGAAVGGPTGATRGGPAGAPAAETETDEETDEETETGTEADIVIGSRYLNESIEDYPLVRRSGIAFFTSVVNRLGGIDITDVTSGFRVYRVPALEALQHHSDRHWAVEQTLEAAKRDLRIREVSVEMETRSAGQSQFTVDTTLLYPARMADVLLRVLLFR